MHWSSKVPSKYKRNAITDELHRAKRIASDFHKETRRIRSKYTDAGYPKLLLKTSLRILTDRKNLHCFDCFCCKARAYFAFVSLHFFYNGTISKAYLTQLTYFSVNVTSSKLPEKVKKPLVFSSFQETWKRNFGLKWVTLPPKTPKGRH